MKDQVIVTVVVLVALVSFVSVAIVPRDAQAHGGSIIYSTNFPTSGSWPAGWTEASGSAWQSGYSGFLGSNAALMWYFYCDPYTSLDCVSTHQSLRSPVIDLTSMELVGHRFEVLLSFRHDWQANYPFGYSEGWVEGSDNGFATSVELMHLAWNNPAYITKKVETIDITSWAAGKPIQIQFRMMMFDDWWWNVDDFSVSASWQPDLPPDTTVDSAFDGEGDPVANGGSTPSTSITLSFTGMDDFTPPAGLGFECSLEDAPFSACSSPQSYLGLAVGGHVFRVRASDEAGNTDSTPASFSWTVVKLVDIDVKPRSDPNAVNPRSRGVIPVAILTDDEFDATDVDPLAVHFGPGGAAPERSAQTEDVDGDGDVDLLFRFQTQETGIQCGDASASLSGQTYDGVPIEGTDPIVTVGCK